MIRCSKRMLANGLRIVAVRLPHLHSAEIAVYLKVGGRNDPLEKGGLSHFLEHMLFRGTADYETTLELEKAFEALGGSVNAATDTDSTCFYSRIHPKHVTEGIGIFASMLIRPTLAGIEVEKRIITEEALEDTNEKGEDINTDNLSSKLLWPDHPLGMPTLGTLESIAGFSDRDVREHFHRYYVPSNAVVVVAGNMDPEELFRACENGFGPWRGGPSPDPLPAPVGLKGPRTLFVKDMDSQVVLQFAFKSFCRFDHRVIPSRLIRRILCGSGSSRLLMSLREKLGITYSVSAGISAYDETGCFSIDMATAPENFPVAVKEVLKETRRLVVEPVDVEELERVKQGYIFDLEYSRDSTYEMGVRYGWGELMGIFSTLEQDRKDIASVTPENIRSTAHDLFFSHNLNLVAVGPVSMALKREVKGLLRGYERDFPGGV